MSDAETANFAHQFQLFNPKNARKVVIFGVGSVGGFLAYSLAKAGVSHIEAWDDDVVSSHNCPMSIYTPHDIGRYKVDTLAERIERETGVQLIMHRVKYIGQIPLRNVSVVSCVHTMRDAGREGIWKQVKGKSSIDIFFDTRTSAHYCEVYAIRPYDHKEIAQYETSLFNDEDAAIQTCGRHGIITTSMRTAGIVASQLLNFWESGEKRLLVRERCDIVTQF